MSNPVVENTATISNSFNNSRGVIGSNVASGQANAQSNNVAVGYVEKALDTPSTAVSAETKSLQKIGGGTENLVGAGNSNTGIYQGDPIDNVATIGGTDTEVFNGANGILGLNVTAGQFNAQGNNVSVVATKNGTELDATTVNIQASIRNDVSYQSLSASTNNATLSNSFVEANGVIGVNLAVGVANGQTNNVALHAGDSVTSTNAVAANIQASVGNAGVGSTSGFESIADSDTTDPLESLVGNYQVADYALSNVYTFDNSGDTDALSIASAGNIASIGGTAFQGANGVIGVNVSAGVGNLQSNNVSLTVASLTTN